MASNSAFAAATWCPAKVPRAAFGVRWKPRSMVADRYRSGRVFLCGDAAHIWIPMGGFGMNAGIEDAVNLAWKLWATLSAWAPPAILDTYEAERRAIGQLVAGSAAKIFEDLYRNTQGIDRQRQPARLRQPPRSEYLLPPNRLKFTPAGAILTPLPIRASHGLDPGPSSVCYLKNFMKSGSRFSFSALTPSCDSSVL